MHGLGNNGKEGER